MIRATGKTAGSHGFQTARVTGRGVVPAAAGTHGNRVQEQRFYLAWIPACAGMTLRS